MKKEGPEYDLGDLSAEIAERYETAIRNAETVQEIVDVVLKAFAAVLPDALSEYSRVELHQIGVFSLANRAARKGRNFGTGDEVVIPARQKVEFHSAPALSKIIEDRTGVDTY